MDEPSLKQEFITKYRDVLLSIFPDIVSELHQGNYERIYALVEKKALTTILRDVGNTRLGMNEERFFKLPENKRRELVEDVVGLLATLKRAEKIL